MAPEPSGMSELSSLFPGLEDIPDPAARVAGRPAPAAAAPSEPSPTRPQRARRSAAALACALAWLGALTALIGLRADARDPVIAASLVLLVALAAAAAALLLRPGARGLPRGLRSVQAAVLAMPLGFAALSVLGARPGEPAMPGSTLHCMSIAAIMMLGPLALASLMLRGTFLSAPGWRGAAVGALCALAGAVGIHACCPSLSMEHVLLAHGLPILGGAAIGAAAATIGGRV